MSTVASAIASYPLTALTVVFGPPSEPHASFEAFQTRADRWESVVEHDWARHEYAALDALTHRAGSISTHTLLETVIGGVLQVDVIIADVERQWVRHADGRLYAALTLWSEDVRPRAAGRALHDPALVEALNAVAGALASLDGRAWMTWSSRTGHDPQEPTQLARSAALVGQMAELVIREAPTPAELPADGAVALEPELLTAIRYGREHADLHTAPISHELRALRHLDPMRAEWTNILMDAFFLGALDPAQLRSRVDASERAALAYLFLGRERADRLKANPEITPRFRGEIAAKTFMTAYALERLAPMMSATLFEVMTGER